MAEVRAPGADSMIRLAGLISKGRLRRARGAVLAMALLLGTTAAGVNAAGNDAIAATPLDAKRVAMPDGQNSNGFDRALRLESRSVDGTATGTIEAMLDFPFTGASAALSQPASWCDILMLHFNVKSCGLVRRAGDLALDVGIGRKFDEPSARVYRVNFVFSVVHLSDDVLHIQLVAQDGPLSTRNYRIVVLASPAASRQTVVRLSYAYEYGVIGKMAMQAYLGTLGRNKVGFTIEGADSDGQPRYIRGMRGAVERNAMRYCLAVESFLRSLSRPQHEQIEARLQDWFTSVERYSRQLYEMDRDAYLAMKRNEIARQQAAALSGAGG